MCKPLYISILLLLLAANALAANSADVNVHVVDCISGEPVEFACISNQSHTIGFMADAEGRFSLPTQVAANDSIIISRIGYTQAIFRATELPDTIRLDESPTTLQSVTVVPKKRKTLGGMFIPNPAKRAVMELLHKVDVTNQLTYYCNSEAGRKFKFKHDSRINKIRICLNKNDSISILFSVYRKVDKDWVCIHDRPIVVEVPESDSWKNIVEIDVSELLESQPKGEYMVGFAKANGNRMSLWAGQPIFEDGRERIIGSDQWKSIDTVPGIEIEIEY